MMWEIIFLGLFAAVFQYYTGYRAWFDWDREVIYKNHPGPCKLVVEEGGCEDVTHIGNGLILLSCGFSWDHTKGSIKAIDLNVADEAYDVKIINAPDRDDWLSAPHGLSAWKDPKTGKHFLYVLTHPLTKDKIEVFEVLNSTELKYIKTITDPAFDLMNDLVVVGQDQFYITYYGKYRDGYGYIFSDYARLREGKIYYYDGKKAREVATDFFRPNGLNISPDKTMIYMAEAGGKKLHGFRREAGHSLTKVWERDMGTAVDNIEVDPNNGDLWIGSHPLIWKAMDHFQIFKTVAPSQVLRVKMQDNHVDVIEEIFADDGSSITLSTAATYAKGKLIIGAIVHHTMICDVKYLS